MVDELQALIDAAKSVGYVLGVMAENKECGGDSGEYEALLTMSLRLINNANACETATERIDLELMQGARLARELGITADELADAIERANMA